MAATSKASVLNGPRDLWLVTSHIQLTSTLLIGFFCFRKTGSSILQGPLSHKSELALELFTAPTYTIEWLIYIIQWPISTVEFGDKTIHKTSLAELIL